MTTFFKTLISKARIIVLASQLLLFAPTAYADGIITPSTFKIKFYETGLRKSATGETSPIFQSTSGIEIDLSSPETYSLATAVRPTADTWDQGYALTSNSVVIAGNDTSGCYIQAGATDADTDGTYEVVTNNAALSGMATITENEFGIDGNAFGPANAAVTATVNGIAATTLTVSLVSSSNLTPGGGGTVNRWMFLGTLADPVEITSNNSGTIIYTIDTSESMQIINTCSSVDFVNTKFNISIEQ
jgi:hypothetical protein